MITFLTAPGTPRSLRLSPEYLQAWLDADGLGERLRLAYDRLPPRAEPLERWDLWLELQAALLRSWLPEDLEDTLRRRLQELGEGSFRVRAVLPAGSPEALQREYPRLRGTAAVLEAVRLAWTAVLSAVTGAADLHELSGAVVVQLEAPEGAQVSATPFAAQGGLPAPDLSLLRLAELHGRLLLPDSPRRLQSLLDLGPWAGSFPSVEAEESEFLRAAEASGSSGAGELLRRARQHWIAWVGAHDTAPAGAESVDTGGRHRQFAGSPGAPGLAAGPARVLRTLGRQDGPVVRPGEVLVCPVLPPRLSAAALAAAALVTEQGGRLSYGAVLAARAGLPCVCGVRGAAARIADGDPLFVDGELGIVGLRSAKFV